ncbi:MAG: hypothetical protein C0467_30735 [Planctomycetaceae bacterium]|nr:hypothetical protein [Planctomycetaceae bacterium]
MTRPAVCRGFIEAVVRKGRPATLSEIAQELYGGDEDQQWKSGVSVADECKQAGLLMVSIDYQDIRTTPKGLAFIGKS